MAIRSCLGITDQPATSACFVVEEQEWNRMSSWCVGPGSRRAWTTFQMFAGPGKLRRSEEAVGVQIVSCTTDSRSSLLV